WYVLSLHGALPISIDGGSNDFKEHKAIKDSGADVLVLDHHACDGYSDHALVVNPYLDSYPNKELSGVGVVYKFAQEMDKRFGTDYADDYLDLTAVGMIGDSMQTNSMETRWLIQKGLKNIKNEFLQELFKENLKGDKPTMNNISFNVLPKANALLRVGETSDLDGMFLAFIGHQEITINERLKSENKEETHQRKMTRICNNMYQKQRR